MEALRHLYESVARLQIALAQAGIPSATIGGLAVMVWGDPRLTRDADLKVLLGRDEAARLLAALPPDFQPQADAPEVMLQQLGFIFTQDANQVRIDLLLADLGFDAEAIKRGRAVEVLPGLTITVCSPEDLLIYKMISTRAKDQLDLSGIMRRQRKTLDDAYVEFWLRQFELALDDSTLVQTYRTMRQTIGK